jgi:hypothetical protein
MHSLVKNSVYLLSILLLAACSGSGAGSSSNRTIYTLDANASGVIETINNIVNLTMVSKDA